MKKYYIFGIHSVLAALNNSKRKVYQVQASQLVFNKYKSTISKFNYKIVKSLDLGTIRHQNIIAYVKPLDTQQLNILYKKTKEEVETVVVLDNITDTFNIGSIIRTAVNLNVKNIIVHKPVSGYVENNNVIRSAAGSFEDVNIIPVTNIADTLKEIKELGFWIIGLTEKSKNSIRALDRPGPKIAVVIGSEDKGIRPLVQKKLDVSVRIPIAHNSLNASNAAAIGLYALQDMSSDIL